jgi:hypothetical protein
MTAFFLVLYTRKISEKNSNINGCCAHQQASEMHKKGLANVPTLYRKRDFRVRYVRAEIIQQPPPEQQLPLQQLPA